VVPPLWRCGYERLDDRFPAHGQWDERAALRFLT
jgi:transposase-like protein